MKKIAFGLFFVFIQLNVLSQNLPDINRSVHYYKTDLSEIDALIDEGQPNRAISKLLIVQIQAIATNNLADLTEVYSRLRSTIGYSGKEEQDIQKLFFEQHKLYLSSTGVARSIAAKMLLEWIDDFQISRGFSFDEESLIWPIQYRNDQNTIRLRNNDIQPLKDIYEKDVFAFAQQLMTLSSEEIYSTDIAKYKPTLFDVFVHDKIEQEGYYMFDNACILESTEKFAQMDLTEIYRLQLQLEQLNYKYRRWDAYAFCVVKRLNKCDLQGHDEAFLAILLDFQNKMAQHPASNRFALERATKLAQLANESDWRNPSAYHNGFLDALSIIEKAVKTHPISDFTEDLQRLKQQIQKSSLQFELFNTDYPSEHQLMRVEYRNLTSAYFAIYKVDKIKEPIDFEQNSLKRYDFHLVDSRTLEFEKDSQMHAHNKDFILSKLDETGVFLLVAAPSKEKWMEAQLLEELTENQSIAYEVIQLSDLVVRTQNTEKGFSILVNDAQSGKPVKNALVKVAPRYLNQTSDLSSEIQTGRTDKNGFLLVTEARNFSYSVFSGKDSISSYGYYYSSSKSQQASQMVYTDRSIYRPGQTVFYKTLSFQQNKSDAEFLSNRKLKVFFKDENGTLLHSTEVLTNRYGSSAGSFVLPKSGFPLGTVSIYVNGTYSRQIQVEEYKRPTFEVALENPKGRVVLGAPFTMEGTVMAYAGYPLVNAKVEITANEMRYFPFRCFVRPEWGNYDTSFVVKTDSTGRFRFEFRSDKPKDAYAVYYNFEAKVTDLSGEVQIAQHDLYLGKTSYTLSAIVQEKYRTDENPKAKFDVFNSQDEMQKDVKVFYSIARLEADTWYLDNREESEFKDFSRRSFEKVFPQIRYYEDQQVKFTDIISSSAPSNADFSLASLKPGNYRMNAYTVDEVGDTIRTQEDFMVWNPSNKRNQHLSEFWVENSNSQPEIGESVDFYIGSSYKKSQLLVAVYNEDGLLSMDYKKFKRRKKMAFSVDAANRRGLGIYLSSIHNGKVSSETETLTPIDTSKILHLKLKSISEPLLPGSEQNWEIEISQNGKSIDSAELLVSMYDASLDDFGFHNWQTSLLRDAQIYPSWSNVYVRTKLANSMNWSFPYFYTNVGYGSYAVGSGKGNGVMLRGKIMDASRSDSDFREDAPKMEFTNVSLKMPLPPVEEDKPKKVRENFNETAFFEPQLHVNATGKYCWKFTLPDALTRWKMMAFGHTIDFKTVYHEQTFEARKEVMLETFEPRFWRKGDSLFWVGKVINLSDKDQEVSVSLRIQQLLDEKDVSDLFGTFEIQKHILKSNESKAIQWSIYVPENAPSLIRFEAEASTAEFSDVLRKNVPILESRERIILAQNYSISEKGKLDIQVNDLKNVSNEATILDYSITVYPQPLWSTMLGLAKVMVPTNELNESYFTQFFGASLAKYILDQNPQMKQALKSWQVGSESALMSLLSQNNELKTLLLSETPWVLEADSETEQLRRLGQLLDENQLNKTINDTWIKIKNLQMNDGSWSWIGKQHPSWYITQYFAKGLADLQALGVQIDKSILDRILQVLDKEYERRYAQLNKKERDKNLGLGSMEIEWLYIRAILSLEENDASKYFGSLLSKKWQNFSLSSQSTIGTIALLKGDKDLAKRLMASFQDRAQNKKELGKYWNQNRNGYGWYENNLETQAKLIFFYQKHGEMEESIRAMQTWLLQQKQGQLWDSPKTTALACFALKDFGSKSETQVVRVAFAGEEERTVSNGRPFERNSPKVVNETSAKSGAQLQTETDGIVFVSAQVAFEDKAENIVPSAGEFRMERTYYILEKGKEFEINSERKLQVGDVIKVKLKVISDRDLDFVSIEDSKASGWEPVDAISGYRYEEGTYYLANRDSKTEIFIENLRKGTHQYTYDLKVTMKGSLQVGPSKATCYYAPSFRANTKGERLKIEE